MDKVMLLEVMKKEIEKSTGCTDPGAVSLAVAKAVEVMGKEPERVEVEVSPNVYKNGISVGIPGTDGRGLYLAAALGVFLSGWTQDNLGIYDHVDYERIEKAKGYLDGGKVEIRCLKQVLDPLYIRARVYAGGDCAWAKIQFDYSNIIETGKNHNVIFSKSTGKNEDIVYELISYPVEEVIETIKEMDFEELEFLTSAAMVNKCAAKEGMSNKKAKIGSALAEIIGETSFPYSAMRLSKLYTASAAEARMIGLNVPIMAISGSGNHGITNFLGMAAIAEILDADDVEFARGLAISSAITIYIKGHVKRMTAFCGCSVAAATGVAAGSVYLLGGNYQDMVNAMHSVIGALAGIVCDGAKESCAYKLSTAASAAIEYAYLSKEKKVFVPSGNGIVGYSIEDTFKNLGKLNNPGMVETDKCLLGIIEETQTR